MTKQERQQNKCTPFERARLNPFARRSERSSTIVSGDLNNEEFIEPDLSLFKTNRQICNGAAHEQIIARHNFERDIKVRVKNDRPTTIGERQESFAAKSYTGTRVINLHNKNVPEGVHLAIAVDNRKNLSKNALKKITRNLAGEL